MGCVLGFETANEEHLPFLCFLALPEKPLKSLLFWDFCNCLISLVTHLDGSKVEVVARGEVICHTAAFSK